MKVGGEREKRKKKADPFQKRREFQQEEKTNESLVFISTLFDTRTESSFERFFVSSPFRLLCQFLPLIRPVSTNAIPTIPFDPLFSPSLPYLLPSPFPSFEDNSCTDMRIERERERALFPDGFQVLLVRMRASIEGCCDLLKWHVRIVCNEIDN